MKRGCPGRVDTLAWCEVMYVPRSQAPVSWPPLAASLHLELCCCSKATEVSSELAFIIRRKSDACRL